MNWNNWPYWVKGMLLGIFLFPLLYIAEEQYISAYSWRQDHPYLTGIHGIIATPTFIVAMVLTPVFCTPTKMEQGGTTDCFRTLKTIDSALELLEFVFACTLLGKLYEKIKNHRKIDVNGNIS